MSRRVTLSLVVLLLVVAGLLPVVAMVARSVVIDGHVSLEAYTGLLTTPRQWTLLGNSLALAVLVTLLAVGMGVPLGILLDRTDLPLRRPLAALFVVPLLVPPYILAVAWSDLVGRGGWLAPVIGTAAACALDRLLFGLPGCVLVLTAVFLPVPLLLTMTFLRTVDPRLEDAARLAGGWPDVLREITLPLVLPGVLLSALLVFVLAFGEYGVPAYLRFAVFSVESFTRFSAFYDFRAATAAALPLAGVALVLLLVEHAFLRERTCHLQPVPGQETRPVIGLGRYRGWLFGLVVLLLAVLVAAPLGALVARAGGPSAYAEALARAGGSLARSLQYAAAGATLLAGVGFFIGYLVHTRALWCWRWVDSLAVFLLALPGTVLGIGLVGLWNTPWTGAVYGTPAIVLLGYLARYSALTGRIAAAQLAQIPPAMEEAAQVEGAGWWRRLVWIVAPLARRGLLAAWLVGYLFALRDTGVTMLVYPPGKDTLPVRIFTLMANGSPRLIAALCVIMIGATLLPAGALWALAGSARGKGRRS